jgi:hypothetical protein
MAFLGIPRLVAAFTNHPPDCLTAPLGGWTLRLLALAEVGQKAPDWTPKDVVGFGASAIVAETSYR